MAAARKYSFNTPLYAWDDRKITQAQKEYLQCLNEAADGEDRFKAARGLTWVWEIRAHRSYNYAIYTNILKSPEADRRRFFTLTKAEALAQYRVAQKGARLAMQLATESGLDTGQFAEWVQHNISDRLAELSATSFADLKSHAALAAPNSKPAKTPALTTTAAKLPVPECAIPNSPVTTIRAVAPDTPTIAQQQGIAGVVEIGVSLDANSKITATRILSSPSAVLNQAALSATRQSTFQTEIKDCKPIAAEYRFSIEFVNP
jgi:TonB family protein